MQKKAQQQHTELSIGQLAKQSGCKVQTIRYYEQIGLLPKALRTSGQQRRYREDDVERLRFIRHSRELGFSLDDIRELIRLSAHPEQPCADADHIANQQLGTVKQRIAQLSALQSELERMITQCQGGRIADCRVIEVLANHEHCTTDHTVTNTVDMNPP